MNKLIILTASIIRGDFHIKSIGKFYEYFYNYLESKFEIHHIINIDEPDNLKKYFNKYETMYNYNNIIPEKVNKIYINEENPGFLFAWKKIVKKIEDLDLVNENYLYFWLEDDWEPKNNYDITKFFDICNFTNSAFTFTDKAPLGSFRGGPFMTGSYFINIFNICKYMNNTCDPERQMQRWLRGSYQKNGNSSIHRFSIENKNVSNDIIHIIIICEESNINLSDLKKHHYINSFDKSIKFNFHLITYNSKYNLKYSSIDNSNNYNLLKINQNKLNKIFSNNYIKYFIIKPAIMFDIGRIFNDEYGLQKWMKIEDNTGYANIKFYNAYLGNWKVFNENELRLKPEYTMNIGFFSALAYIHQCLPYLENKYFNKDIKLNIQYYSHNYGSYPNFQVIGDLIQLNYIPSINKNNEQFEELNCLEQLFKKISEKQISNEDNSLFSSYKDDFELANKYFFKYFKFDNIIINETEKFVEKFLNKKVLGLHYKINVNSYTSIDEFIKIIDYYLNKNKYQIIFICTDNSNLILKINEKYSNKYEILCYNDLKNNNIFNLNRLTLIENNIEKIKNNSSIENLIILENSLKQEILINKLILKNNIVNSLILSKCDFVIKTCSQISAYSKIFNPKLDIYKVNNSFNTEWPDSHIKLYDYIK